MIEQIKQNLIQTFGQYVGISQFESELEKQEYNILEDLKTLNTEGFNKYALNNIGRITLLRENSYLTNNSLIEVIDINQGNRNKKKLSIQNPEILLENILSPKEPNFSDIELN